MEKIKKLSERFKSRLRSIGPKRHPKPEIIPENLILTRLNNDIFLYLKQFLTPAPLTCLALTCKSLKCIIGCDHWRGLALNPDRFLYRKEYLHFLQLLEADDPDLITCHHCLLLHKGDRHHYLSTPRLPGRHRECLAQESMNLAHWSTHPHFFFGVFQMTMKKYRMGGDYKPFLDLLQYNGRPEVQGMFPVRLSAIARIIKGSMFLKIQHDTFVATSLEITHNMRYYLPLCPHTVLFRRDDKFGLNNGECQRGRTTKLKENVTLSDMKRCFVCGLEFHIMMQLFEGIGWVVRVVKWLNVGEGHCPRDEKWWRYLGCQYLLHDAFPSPLHQHPNNVFWCFSPPKCLGKERNAKKFRRAWGVKTEIVTVEEMEELRALELLRPKLIAPSGVYTTPRLWLGILRFIH